MYRPKGRLNTVNLKITNDPTDGINGYIITVVVVVVVVVVSNITTLHKTNEIKSNQIK